MLADSDRPMALVTPLLLALLLALPVPAAAQPRERVDSSLPSLEAPPRGDRVIGTRAQRLRSEAQLREELIRQNELDRLFNPHRGVTDALVPVFPSVFPPLWPCAGRGCAPPAPHPPVPFPDRYPVPHR
jgi:hypothetical protein